MPRARESGFTLLEVLVVVAVIGVLAAISAPAVQAGLDRYALISASQQVASTIRTARWQAVAKNKTLRLRFDYPDDSEYQVVDTSDDAVGSVQYLPGGITFDSFEDLEFDPEGRLIDPAAATSIVVTNDDDQDSTITVSTSGRVQLQ